MAPALFPDNTVLINFACINRLDLLERWLRERGRWTEAVQFEASRSARYWPALQTVIDAGWLGEAIAPAGKDVEKIERIRRTVFGGTRREPLKHLGESQTCFLLGHDAQWRGAWWITDDRDAGDFSRAQGITTRQTIDVFGGIVADGDLTAEAAFILMRKIQGHDRKLTMPAQPDDFR